MSDLTPTNEEGFSKLVQDLKEGETIVLLPSHPKRELRISMLEVYIVPKRYDTTLLYNLHSMGMGPDDPGLKPFWRGSYMALEFHPEVWEEVQSSKASRYR